jgi:hypothetical protein
MPKDANDFAVRLSASILQISAAIHALWSTVTYHPAMIAPALTDVLLEVWWVAADIKRSRDYLF